MKPRVAFIPEVRSILIERILYSKHVEESALQSKKYRQIHSSIQEIGLIEPLAVVSVADQPEQYLLLDGHYRLTALISDGHTEVPCIFSLDDESFTYNYRVNRLSPVQEHLMILAAVNKGITVERLSKALSVNASYVADRVRLLKGICEEAAEALRYREFPVGVCRVLRRMKSPRQVECVQLMIAANNLTLAFAEALLVGTASESLVAPRKGGNSRKISVEDLAKMKDELHKVQSRHKEVEQVLGEDLLNLSFACRYIGRLLDSSEISTFLQVKYPEIHEELSNMVKLQMH